MREFFIFLMDLMLGAILGAVFCATAWGDRTATWIANQIDRWEGHK